MLYYNTTQVLEGININKINRQIIIEVTFQIRVLDFYQFMMLVVFYCKKLKILWKLIKIVSLEKAI